MVPLNAKAYLMRKLSLATGFVLALAPLEGFTQDLEKGLAAAQSGDFATALKEWRPLAEQGNLTAQNNLGLMYERGQGVTQDLAEAVNWYRKAARQGYAGAQSVWI